MCAETMKTPLSLDGVTVQVAGPNKENLLRLREEWDDWLEGRTPRGLDTSFANLSSLMFLVESKDHRKILFTGDGRPDEVVDALKAASVLTDEVKTLKVDVLKLPHHGSIRNATPSFSAPSGRRTTSSRPTARTATRISKRCGC